MGCGCGKERRAHGGITSNVGAPLSPVEAAANAIANAKGEAYSADQTKPSAGSDQQE